MEDHPPEEVLEVLGNSYSAEILVAAAEPKSAQELSAELDIPIATCYRRLDELSEVGLLDSYAGPATQRETTYQRTVDDLYIDVTDSLSISITRPSKVKTTLDAVWQELR